MVWRLLLVGAIVGSTEASLAGLVRLRDWRGWESGATTKHGSPEPGAYVQPAARDVEGSTEGTEPFPSRTGFPVRTGEFSDLKQPASVGSQACSEERLADPWGYSLRTTVLMALSLAALYALGSRFLVPRLLAHSLEGSFSCQVALLILQPTCCSLVLQDVAVRGWLLELVHSYALAEYLPARLHTVRLHQLRLTVRFVSVLRAVLLAFPRTKFAR